MKMITIVICLLAFNLNAQQWVEVEGKWYKQEQKEDYYDTLFNKWESEQNNEVTISGIFDKAKIAKEIFEWIKRNRFTEQERNVYNFGVKTLNEMAESEVLKRIE